MKKSLLALAVLGAFAGGAVAQSSVTIYGTISQGIVKSNNGTAPSYGTPAGGLPDATSNEAWQVMQGFSSRLGFMGNEDLGGGMSAQFQIEHRFNPDDGNITSPAFWNGRTYVQLTTGFGSVYLGREYSPAFTIGSKTDPFGWNTVGQMGQAQWAYYTTTSGIRVNNVVGYRSPKFGGVSVNLDVAPSENSTTGRTFGGNVEYAAGPLYVGLGFDTVDKGTQRDGNSLVNLGVAYDFGFIRPMLYLSRSKIDTTTNAVTSPLGTHKFIGLGATAPVGPGKLKAMVYRLAPDTNGDETKFGIGYDYPLSKRTFIYVDASSAKKDDVGAQTFSNRNAFDIGIQHTF